MDDSEIAEFLGSLPPVEVLGGCPSDHHAVAEAAVVERFEDPIEVRMWVTARGGRIGTATESSIPDAEKPAPGETYTRKPAPGLAYLIPRSALPG
jgi:hypothetical protein